MVGEVLETYQIDMDWYESSNRSFQVLTEKRMCPSCQAKLGTPVEERRPVPDPETGTVVFRSIIVPYGSDSIATIQRCCSDTPEFRNPRLPLMEVIFRVFLMEGNTPMTGEELRLKVLEWIGPDDGRVVTIAILKRLIEADDYYGIRTIPIPAEV